jgi:hypothetical protein
MRSLIVPIVLLAFAFTASAQTNEQPANPAAGSRSQADAATAQYKTNQEIQETARQNRKANPLAWEQSLDPMPQGNWKLLFLANDGSMAIFVSSHQQSRSGTKLTVWFRTELGEAQDGTMSFVEKDQFDCADARKRMLSVSKFPQSNLQGDAKSFDPDPSLVPWVSLSPGSVGEQLWQLLCGKSASQ